MLVYSSVFQGRKGDSKEGFSHDPGPKKGAALSDLLVHSSIGLPTGSTYINTQTAKFDPPKPHVKEESYVILPGHPFYGKAVTVLQKGRTSTHEWCLIAHPERPGFHYRIPSRWLDHNCPEPQQQNSYYQQKITLSFHYLQKLAAYVECTLQCEAVILPANKMSFPLILPGRDINAGEKNLEEDPSKAEGVTGA